MDALTILLIGHRGTGKTTFLHRLGVRGAAVLDLDAEVERNAGQTIPEIFAREGEAGFRARERAVLDQLIKIPNRIIALGAGFAGPPPPDTYVIWLKRVTDGQGRIFRDRPRLDPEVDAFAEYQRRFEAREILYRQWAHEVLVLPEGYDGGLEDFVLAPGQLRVPYDMTLLPGENHPQFWERRRGWNLRRLEWRDDLRPARVEIAPILYSHRTSTDGWPTDGSEVDWALELGAPPREPQILSLHEREPDLESSFARFANTRAIRKHSVVIKTFNELLRGHRWWLEDPERRAFLPRSPDGRWRWYRNLFGPRMPLHFIREDLGSALDQPYLWETLLIAPAKTNGPFAALLGSPVAHSRSPIEHRAFFKDRPFVAIDVREEEFAEAFAVLRKLGLTHAAVTSPLKKLAAAACTTLTDEARELGSVNTLMIVDEIIAGHNTDVLALADLRRPDDTDVIIWGGGGTLPGLQKVWPHARVVPARQGCTRDAAPDLLIWAVGRSREFKWPPATLRPRRVLDLNYGDDSPGLEWAAARNLPYQSGLKMFKLQAAYQRAYWQGLHP